MFNTIILKKGYGQYPGKKEDFEKGSTIWGVDSNAEEIKRWKIEDKETALEEFENYKSSYIQGIADYNVEEYALEYCECDEDGDFISGSDYDLADSAETYNVEFSGGESRFGNDSVNYMLVEIDDEELYAEHLICSKCEKYHTYECPYITDYTECPDYDEFEGFEELKEEIIEQAAKLGINSEYLIFEEE